MTAERVVHNRNSRFGFTCNVLERRAGIEIYKHNFEPGLAMYELKPKVTYFKDDWKKNKGSIIVRSELGEDKIWIEMSHDFVESEVEVQKSAVQLALLRAMTIGRKEIWFKNVSGVDNEVVMQTRETVERINEMDRDESLVEILMMFQKSSESDIIR
jgi:hypothetical protein